jgi:hypothetical protein
MRDPRQIEMFKQEEMSPNHFSGMMELVVDCINLMPRPVRQGKHCLVYCGPERCDCGVSKRARSAFR